MSGKTDMLLREAVDYVMGKPARSAQLYCAEAYFDEYYHRLERHLPKTFTTISYLYRNHRIIILPNNSRLFMNAGE